MRNQQVRTESEGLRSASEKLPIQKSESERTQRIREVIGVESVTAFGRRCGIGEATLRKYLSGAVPNTDNLVAIADAANVNIEWLAAGRGPKQRGAALAAVPAAPAPAEAINLDQLTVAISAVAEGLDAIERHLPPAKHAQLIISAYGMLGELHQRDMAAQRRNLVQLIKTAA
jgi:transcriptional regulator with XRE-family HTH domain